MFTYLHSKQTNSVNLKLLLNYKKFSVFMTKYFAKYTVFLYMLKFISNKKCMVTTHYIDCIYSKIFSNVV